MCAVSRRVDLTSDVFKRSCADCAKWQVGDLVQNVLAKHCRKQCVSAVSIGACSGARSVLVIVRVAQASKSFGANVHYRINGLVQECTVIKSVVQSALIKKLQCKVCTERSSTVV